MLSIKECLDYVDLNEDEVKTIAHHEHISFDAAAQMGCALAQDCAGEEVLRTILEDEVCEAAAAAAVAAGEEEELRLAERAFFHFATHHPAAD
ncbi:MAG TPA: hypothetical protein VGK09_06240 [Rhodocyclaceae bacterium]|jgi:hypothetical protein